MSIRELYEWAIKAGVADYNIILTYADGGGFYTGTRDVHWGDAIIHHDTEEVEL